MKIHVLLTIAAFHAAPLAIAEDMLILVPIGGDSPSKYVGQVVKMEDGMSFEVRSLESVTHEQRKLYDNYIVPAIESNGDRLVEVLEFLRGQIVNVQEQVRVGKHYELQLTCELPDADGLRVTYKAEQVALKDVLEHFSREFGGRVEIIGYKIAIVPK